MVVKSVQVSSIDNRRNYQKNQNNQNNNVAFTGINPVVGLMDFIDKGGYATSFVLQDGLGFVAPRVGKGILRGGKEKTDENGNIIYDKKGNPKHEYNWAFARKEGIREVVTGPSAVLIPVALLPAIKRFFGSANAVKLNYIDGFTKPFAEYASANLENLVSGTPNKADFYHRVFTNVINTSINDHLPNAEKLSAEEVDVIAKEYTARQISIENINADKSLNKKAKAAKIAEIGTVEESFAKLKKSKIGGITNEYVAEFVGSKGTKSGSTGELLHAMKDYFGDAVNNTKKVVKEGASADEIANAVKSFANRRMGSRILTNIGIFAAVAAFFTQIPKLYNMGLKGNPALSEMQADNIANANDTANKGSKDVAFTGFGRVLEKGGQKVFNGKAAKSVSDIFELNGNIISGTAMPVLLYGFCIPPRLKHAQDKYDYGEIGVRDLTSFTALLFGAKAIARGFSDMFTKLTGLALNHKNLEGRNVFQKTIDYLNPNDTRHGVLSTKQLNIKYTNLEEYKGGVEGFIEFIEKSGGNIKKAFSMDKDVRTTVEEILQEFNGKSYKDASVDEIKNALKNANKNKTELITKFYNLFKNENGLLKKAKTCNSAFGFLSTLVLVPSFIIWLTNVCEKMTKNRTEKDFAETKAKYMNKIATEWLPSSTPTMAGFLNKK